MSNSNIDPALTIGRSGSGSSSRNRIRRLLRQRAWRLASGAGVAATLVLPLLGSTVPVAQAAGPTCTASDLTTTCTFGYTGAAQFWTVPQGVSQATFDLYGGAGADTGGTINAVDGQVQVPVVSGGKGAHVQAKVSVTACQVLGVYVGGQGTIQNGSGGVATGVGGFNGGADTGVQDLTTVTTVAGGGGGASDIRGPGSGLSERLAIAGGGGGGYYGGGGGGGGGQTVPGMGSGGGGGGGGSSFGPSGAVVEQGVQSDNGKVAVTYTLTPPQSQSSGGQISIQLPCSGSSTTPTPQPTAGPAKRADLAGSRIEAAGGPDIYLIDDDGTKRHVPDPTTYNNLFRDWTGIKTIDPATVASGPDLTSGAYLAWDGVAGDPIYLVSNGQKRHIASPAVFDKFWFASSKVQTVSQSTLNALPNGPDIT